jgi:hypothetical protein
MVEIRRDTYMIEPGGPPTAGIDTVIAALTSLVDAVSGVPNRPTIGVVP